MALLTSKVTIGQPAIGVKSYNGYTFDGAATCKVKITPIKDDAQRVTIKHKITYTISGYIQNSDGTDIFSADLRTKLMKQGGILKITGTGFGDIDTSGLHPLNGSKDIFNGPNPEDLQLESIGANKAMAFIYVISVTVPVPCLIAANGALNVINAGVTAFNFTVDFDFNDGGYCTRTIAGYLEIAQNVGDDSRPLWDVDNYRSRLRVPDLPNFKRNQKYAVSADRTRLNFTITDAEIESPNAYPFGVQEIDAHHRLSWQRSNKQGMVLRNFVTADIKLLPGAKPERALRIFLDILFRRIEAAEKNGIPILLDSLDLDDSLYSRDGSFSASYRALRGIKDFVDMGLWTATGDTWEQWTLGAKVAKDVRGHTQLKFTKGEDIIISLCNQNSGSLFQDALRPEPRSEPERDKKKIENKKPPPARSYLDYQQKIVPESTTPSYRQRTLQTPYSSNPGSLNMESTLLDLGTGSGTPDVIQLSGKTSIDLTLAGSATRAGYDVPRPRLDRFGNQTPVETYAYFESSVIAVVFGLPIYRAQWMINYLLPALPGTVSNRPNIEQLA